MKKVSLYVLAGDGIGPEVMKASWPVLEKALEGSGLSIEAEEGLAGGCSLEAHGVPLLPETLEKAKKADAVLLGAVGGPKWDTLPHEKRPERALLALRAGLGLFANIRPARVFSSLIQASTLKEEVIRGIDLLVVRELTGGIYFGEPRGREKIEGGFKAYNSEVYSTHEIVRIAKIAFEAAKVRGKKVMSVDKANILESSILWREVVTNMAKDYPDIQLDHMYVDNCAMQLVRNPRQFDVIVTNNIFGDILSDEAAMLTGSIGMLPSASLGSQKNSLGFPSGMYEPVHGSAPDIAGKNLANPLANILSIAMMMRHSLGLNDAATKIEKAVEKTLDAGYRTGDIFEEGMKKVGTKEMAAQVLSLL